MAITRSHLIGFAAGIGAAAAGFYFYSKNQDKVDAFLRAHGMNVPVRSGKDIESMSAEELATLKERIEDQLATLAQAEAGQDAAPAEDAEAPSAKPRAKRAKKA